MAATRRAFLKQSLAVTGAITLAPSTLQASSRVATRPGPNSIPPHQSLQVPGVHAYADRESALAGETIRFHVSNDRPIRAAVCRLGLDIDDPAQDETLVDFGEIPATVQPIHPGSYVHVAKGVRTTLNRFTIEAWVRPWRVDRLMGVVSQEDKESSEGWALGIGKEGYVGFYLGDGISEDDVLVHRTGSSAVQRGRWHHLVARWDGARKQVWIDGRLAGEWRFPGPLRPGPHPIRLGAMSEKGITTRFLDGDLAMVALYADAIPDSLIVRRYAERGSKPPEAGRNSPSSIGAWTFAEEQGDQVRDLTRQRRHGRLINHGTWMIGGPSFDASVSRFSSYRPDADPDRGHGLRLLSDDLYDCRWNASLAWKVPATARSGFYVLRLRWEGDGQNYLQHATFLVRRPHRRRPAPILLLAATNTWRAYNSAAFGVPRPGARQLCGTDGLPNSLGDPPAFSFYRGHTAGPGTYQIGRYLPWPAAGPYLRYGDATDYSHLLRAERFAQTWLEREGYDYQVIADHDLHLDPDQLRPHRVLVINGHNEYWSVAMYRGLEKFLAGGGRVIVLSGNSLFWRVSFSPDGAVMECRKVDAPGDQLRPDQRGEAWHSHDGQRGGLMRETGFPGGKLIGLETLGWNNQGDIRNFGPWIVDETGHPVFHTPEETGLQAGDRFGWTGEGQTPMANGHEIDVRPSTLASLATSPIPPGATMPQDPRGLRRLANGVIPWQFGGTAFDYFFRPIKPKTDQGGEMIWWERPEGGLVFNAGTIGSGWALHADPRWATLLRNVLHHLGVPKPSRDGDRPPTSPARA